MKKINIVVLTLVITGLLIFSTLNFSNKIIASSRQSVESLEVTKKVFDGENWVDEIEEEYGGTVEFKITITYHNVTDPSNAHWAQNIIAIDTLPDCLEYVTGTSLPMEPDISDNVLTWDFGTTVILDGESLVITFDASVVDYGINVNEVVVDADEYCTGEKLQSSDTATVNVPIPLPGIVVEKKVLDGTCNWVEERYADYCTNVLFNITVENVGNIDLLNVFVNDTLPESLEYVIDSAIVNGIPEEPFISPNGKILTWFFNVVEIGEIIYIEFEAHVIGLPCSVDVNWAEATGEDYCGQTVTDSDSATVIVNGMCMEKEVWDKGIGAWMEETDVSVGEKVKFRIMVIYHGTLSLKYIHIRDELPGCLEYVTGSGVPNEPEISDDGQTLWWNLTGVILYNGGTTVVEFEALVQENNCQPCINLANVTASECGIKTVYWEDPATVNIDCAFIADAGDIYYGEIDEDVEISGSATGGDPPYTFEWDLDDDGDYDDATGEEVTWSWADDGSYEIHLKVTDDQDKNAYDTAAVIIAPSENNPPNKPSRPSGNSNGKPYVAYTYKSTTSDPDGDHIWYWFEWGDGTNSGWVGEYDSGQEGNASHQWSNMGNYQIKVKAKDIHGAESVWSEPMPVTIPRDNSNLLIWILQKLIEMFPVLEPILGPILNNLLN